jgi:hypothetical protein
VSTAFLPPNSSCCCRKDLNNWNTISNPQQIAAIKSNKNYVYRGILQCSALKQKTIKQKNIISGNIRGSVRERATRQDGSTRTNLGSGRGSNSSYSSLSVECACSSSGPYFTLIMIGLLKGAYTFENGFVQPYSVEFDMVVPNIVFLCASGGTSMEIWSEYAFGSNTTEDPKENYPVNGLISQGSANVNIFGTSIFINLPYNTWDPDWKTFDTYSASSTVNATIVLTRQDC